MVLSAGVSGLRRVLINSIRSYSVWMTMGIYKILQSIAIVCDEIL